MCLPKLDPATLQPNLVVLVYAMEYPLPGPVVALLQQERASLAPKSYFISSGKKSIKITLVYAKGEQPPAGPVGSASAERKKSRHGSSSKQASKPTTRRTRSKNLSESSSSPNNDSASGSVSHSDAEQACVSPDLILRKEHQRDRERLSTVDSGHPSSLGTVVNDHEAQSESGSEAGDEGDGPGCDSISSSDSEKPRTPGREIAVPASSIGPGETPAARRDEMWQTWTRIPRTQASSRRYLSAPISTVRRSLSPSTPFAQRTTSTSVTQRRPRLHEGVSWDGSGNL